MTALPDDLPLVERTAVRVVLLDVENRVLLFHTHDATDPELGTWWELPGGGVETGESYAQTAVRELAEETGIVVSPVNVRPPNWRRTASYRHHGERRLQHETVVLARISTAAPVVDGSGRVAFENDDYFGYRWWRIGEILGSSENFYPGQLPVLLNDFLAGEQIDQPFELWS